MSSALIKKLTTDDTSVLSAYAMKELSDYTLRSQAECDSIREQLLSRLEKPSPDVKLKVLRTIKYVAQNGRPDFRITLQRNLGSIKQCQNFRAPTDPLRGDTPSDRVREAAKEALDAIFNQGQTVSSSNISSGRIKGFGGGVEESSQPEFVISNASATELYQVVKQKVATTVQDIKASSLANSFSTGVFSNSSVQSNPYTHQEVNNYSSSSTQSVTPNKYGGIGSDGSFTPAMGSTAGTVQQSTSNEPYSTYNSNTSTYNSSANISNSNTSRTRGAVGGGWGDDDDDTPTPTLKPFSVTGSSQKNFGLGPTSAASPQATIQSVKSTEPQSREPGPYEIKLIDDLTAPTGIRTGLTLAEKNGFLSKCASLDNLTISICLDRKLGSSQNQNTIIKTLYLIEALLQNNSDDADDYFNDHPQNLYKTEQHAAKSVQALTLKCLVLLGLRTKDSVANIIQTTPTTSVAPIAPATYDIFGNAIPTSSPSSTSTVTTPISKPTPSNPNDISSLFGNLNISSAPKSTKPMKEEPSSFDFLTDTSATTSTKSTSSAFDDLFNNVNTNSATVGTTSSTSAFDNLLNEDTSSHVSNNNDPLATLMMGSSNNNIMNNTSSSFNNDIFGNTTSHSSYNSNNDVFANLGGDSKGATNVNDIFNAKPSTTTQSTSVDPFAFIDEM